MDDHNPQEKRFNVSPVCVTYTCEFCNEGEMKYNPDGNILYSNPPLIPHICDKCKKEMHLRKTYPYIDWKRGDIINIESQIAPLKIGDRVIFVDDINGTALSNNGRLGCIEDISRSKVDEEVEYYLVKWDDNQHPNDDGHMYVVPKCICQYDEGSCTPELYALAMWYKYYGGGYS